MIAASAVLIWSVMPPAPRQERIADMTPVLSLQGRVIPLQDAAMLGSDSAQLVVLGFSDFDCPFCRKFATETLPQLRSRYIDTGKVAYAFRHAPLQDLHPGALERAAIAECARRQGRFWETHDRLFEAGLRQRPDASTVAVTAGLHLQTLSSCVPTDGQRSVHEDLALAKILGIAATPTFLLGTRMPDRQMKVSRLVSGAQALAVFAEAIDELLGTSEGKGRD
jgi:protein-disulfide isomerase